MKAVDLFCGAGGAAQGLKNAGFSKIVGIDIEYQPEYPFEFIHSDVFNVELDFFKDFDFVWSSPPCQAYTFATEKSRNLGKVYPDLVKLTRQLLLKINKPFVIENVPSAPIRQDLLLCGEMFGLRIIRHRIFEINGFNIIQPLHPQHKGSVKDEYYVTVAGHGGDGIASLSEWQCAIDINWIFDKKMLAEAVPPAYSEYIGYFVLNNMDIHYIYNKAIFNISNHRYKQKSLII